MPIWLIYYCICNKGLINPPLKLQRIATYSS